MRNEVKNLEGKNRVWKDASHHRWFIENAQKIAPRLEIFIHKSDQSNNCSDVIQSQWLITYFVIIQLFCNKGYDISLNIFQDEFLCESKCIGLFPVGPRVNFKKRLDSFRGLLKSNSSNLCQWPGSVEHIEKMKMLMPMRWKNREGHYLSNLLCILPNFLCHFLPNQTLTCRSSLALKTHQAVH